MAPAGVVSDPRAAAPFARCKAAADGEIAVATASHTVFVVLPGDLRVVHKLKHPSKCFGCSWNTFSRNQLATSCEDGVVRIFAFSQGSVGAPTLLVGHAAKIFNVLWSPLLPGVLISGSDDCSVRVWDVPRGTSRAMAGHTHNVRALAWSHELPWLALSGSWDGTLRLWDTRSCEGVAVLRDHHADIYAITAHPLRPSIFISTSRDTTMRTWCLDDALAFALLPLLLNQPLSRDIASRAMDTGSSQALCGMSSGDLLQRLGQAQSPAARFGLIFDFFRPARGMRDLWDMLEDQSSSGRQRRDSEVVHADFLLEERRDLLRQLMHDKDISSSRMVSGRRMKQEERP